VAERSKDQSTGAADASDTLSRSEAHFRKLLDVMSQGVLYQDAEGRIVDANTAALNMLGLTIEEIRGRTPFDEKWRIICADGTDFPPKLHPSLIALRTGASERLEMGIYNPSEESFRWVEVSAVPYYRPGDITPSEVHTTLDDVPERRRLEAERDRLVQQLEDALANLKVLSGFIPICSSCKKIRNDSGYWQQLEVYMRDHSDAQFSHGVCPDCMKRLYPEFADDQGKELGDRR